MALPLVFHIFVIILTGANLRLRLSVLFFLMLLLFVEWRKGAKEGVRNVARFSLSIEKRVSENGNCCSWVMKEN